MWIVSVLAVNIAAALLTVGAANRVGEEKKMLPWDIPRAAATFTTIVGSLSGFAVATSIFVANLRVNQSSPEFESVMGLFLTGFIILVATAMMFGSIPNHPQQTSRQERLGSTQSITYALANVNYYLGIASTWLGLRPLLTALQLPVLASVFTWILLVVVVAGGFRVSMYTYRLTHFPKVIVFLVPSISFGLTLLYRLTFVPTFPALWPFGSPPLAFMMVLFALGATGFVASNFLIQSMSEKPPRRKALKRRQNLLLAHTQIVSCSVFFLWWAVTLG